jgi:dienelactone hydrolase
MTNVIYDIIRCAAYLKGEKMKLRHLIILLLMTVLPAYAQEALVFPELTGEYQVGVASYPLVDEAREEIFSEESGSSREVLLTVYYPAEPAADAETAPYVEGALREFIGVPPEQLDQIQTQLYANAPAAEGRYPVVLFSPGMGALPTVYSTILAELASHGYVVAAVWHPYSTGVTVFPDGRIVFANAAGYVGLETTPEVEAGIGAVWADDLIFVLDTLEQFNDTDPLLAGHLDLERVGVFGQSFGGGAAAEASYLDSRFDAVANLDGPLFGNVVGQSLSQPLMVMFSNEWDLSIDDESLAALGVSRETYEQVITDYIDLYTSRSQHLLDNATAGYSVRIFGASHFTFATDMGVFSPSTVDAVTGERAVEVISAYVVAFFDQHLNGIESPLLAGNSADYPEVELEVTSSAS